MFSAAKNHTLARIKAAKIRRAPFAHVLIDEIFPADFYAEMMRRKMSDSCYTPLVETGRVGGGYSAARLCFLPAMATASGSGDDQANAQFWTDFFAAYNDKEFLNAWGSLFKADVKQRVEEEPERFANGNDHVRVVSEIFLMRDKRSYGLVPHMDSVTKAISALFYLPADDRDVMMGTSLYTPRSLETVPRRGLHAGKREDFDHVAIMPYKPNTVFAFPNVMPSFHGVEPIDQPASRDILLYDLKFIGLKASRTKAED